MLKVLILFLCVSASAADLFFAAAFQNNRRQLILQKAPVAAAGGSGGLLTTLLNETFEGTGYAVPTWTEQGSGGTIDPDYTGVVLDGSQSWRIVTPDSASRYAYHSYTSGSERWVYMMFRSVAHPASDITLFELWDSGFTEIASLHLRSTGKFFVECGSTASSDTTDAISNGTTYHIYVRYLKGSGANGVANVGFSTDGTRPTSGTKFIETTTGTATADANYIAAGFIGFDGVNEGIFDKVQVGDADSEP